MTELACPICGKKFGKRSIIAQAALNVHQRRCTGRPKRKSKSGKHFSRQEQIGRARLRGHHDYTGGRYANPYKVRHMAGAWLSGWNDARREHQRGQVTHER